MKYFPSSLSTIILTISLLIAAIAPKALHAALPASAPVYDADMVDERPGFPGGDSEMVRFINSTRHYPETAYTSHIQGRVLCSFVVCADGHIEDVRVVRGVAEELDREAVRVILAMPRWHAARHGGVAVATKCYLPIHFRR